MRRNVGFTLIELLVATSITLVLAAVMVRVTADVLSVWQTTQDRQVQVTTARQALDALERDFHSVIWRRDTNVYLAVDILDSASELANHGWLLSAAGPIKPANGGSLLPLPSPTLSVPEPRLADARFGLSGAWLRLIACNVESGGTMPVLVAYQIARRPVVGNPTTTNAAPVRYGLYRSAISTSETFAVGYTVTSGYGSSLNTVSAINASTYRNRSNATNPSHANLLASNVVDFACWLYRRESTGALTRIYPAVAGDKSHAATGSSTANDSRMPDAIDVGLRVLSERGATLLDAIEAGRVPRPVEFATDADWWWSVVEKNSAWFGRRIEVKGGAL
jgi:type II secretory pathway pseudopilin PulG